jgi:DNA repair protein RecN (Recombination protein N)
LYSEDGSIVERLSTVERNLTTLKDVDAAVASLAEVVTSALVQLEEAAGDLKDYLSHLSLDPFRLEEIELRLEEIQRLKRKYKSLAIENILNYRQELVQQLQSVTDVGHAIDQLETQWSSAQRQLQELGARLSAERHAASGLLKEEIERELATLGMTKTTFDILRRNIASKGDTLVINGTTYGPRGSEDIEFLISPNVGEDPKPLSKIASGGELSRIMLAIKKILTKREEDQTLVFDEVDAGIGGEAAQIVGRKLRSLADYNQILCVTHLPQIASYGQSHYRVTKSEANRRTIARVERMEGGQVVDELARMLSGKKISTTTRAHAEELLQRAKREIE